MFFDPAEFLERDPASAKTPVEAARLEREAVQRARLCEAMVELAAARGYEAAQAHRVFGAAEIVLQRSSGDRHRRMSRRGIGEPRDARMIFSAKSAVCVS